MLKLFKNKKFSSYALAEVCQGWLVTHIYPRVLVYMWMCFPLKRTLTKLFFLAVGRPTIHSTKCRALEEGNNITWSLTFYQVYPILSPGFMLAVMLIFQCVFLGPWCRCWHQKIPILLDLLIRNQTSLNQCKVQVSCFGVWQLSYGIFIFLVLSFV